MSENFSGGKSTLNSLAIAVRNATASTDDTSDMSKDFAKSGSAFSSRNLRVNAPTRSLVEDIRVSLLVSARKSGIYDKYVTVQGELSKQNAKTREFLAVSWPSAFQFSDNMDTASSIYSVNVVESSTT